MVEVSKNDLSKQDDSALVLQLVDSPLYAARFCGDKFVKLVDRYYVYTDNQLKLLLRSIHRESKLLELQDDLMY